MVEANKKIYADGNSVAENTRKRNADDLLGAVISGEVLLSLPAPVYLKMVGKLYNVIQTVPEVRLLKTKGNLQRGFVITIGVDKPIALYEILKAKIPDISFNAIEEQNPAESELAEIPPAIPGRGQPLVPKIITLSAKME